MFHSFGRSGLSRRAEALGIRRLKFAARDGYQAWVAAKTLQDLGFTEVECDYFYSSRAALYFANVINLETDLAWLDGQVPSLSPKKFFKYLSIDIEIAKNILPKFGSINKKLSKNEYDRFKKSIISSDLAGIILRNAASQRELFRDYLRQEKMLGDETWALVDVGWHLNVQSQLSSFTNLDKTRGLYLYISENRQPPAKTGMATSMLPAKIEDVRGEPQPAIWRYTTITEHLFSMAPHGTTLGYERNDQSQVIPVCKCISGEERQGNAALAEQTKRFVHENAAQLARLFSTDADCAEAFRRISDTFLDRPPRGALEGLPEILSVSRELSDENDQKLLKPIGFSDLINIVLVLLRLKRRAGFEWLHGRLVLTGPVASMMISLSNFMRKD